MTDPVALNPKGAEILAALANHIGSETFTRHWLRKSMVMTEGVVDLAERAGAHWLTEIVASVQNKRSVRAEEFQVWTLYVRDFDNPLVYPGGRAGTLRSLDRSYRAVITMTDGNSEAPRYTQRIHFTDFPITNFRLFAEMGSIDGVSRNLVLMLPGER